VLQPQRSAGVFLGTTAVLAMLVAGIGLHYALSYTVEHRRKEIAVRIAIGGSPLAVSADILRRSALLALAASIAGTIGAAAFTPLLAAQAKGVSSRDGVTFLTAGTVLLAGCAMVAAWSMARAARTNLTESLRLE
jgi:putative ABC transport system permease protein